MKTIAEQIKWDFKANGTLVIRDTNGIIYLERHDGYWAKWEYDSQDKPLYYEDSDGTIRDNRPKPLEIEVTTTKTYKVGDSVECLTDDGWMDGGITDIDLSKRVLFVYIEDYDEIRKFNTNQIK